MMVWQKEATGQDEDHIDDKNKDKVNDSGFAITVAIKRTMYGPVHKTQVNLPQCNCNRNSYHPSDLAK